ncbi:MAG TPA: MFS transporter, partial [Erythrobacter sp.]|nr:MFS transporter [Erythrobacter sp.]
MATAAARQTSGSVRVTLWILLVVYIFNFIDRQIVNILAEPIRLELG